MRVPTQGPDAWLVPVSPLPTPMKAVNGLPRSPFRVPTPIGFLAESDAQHALCGDEAPTGSDPMLSNALSDEQEGQRRIRCSK